MRLLLISFMLLLTGCQQATPNWAMVSALLGPTLTEEDSDPDKPLAQEYQPNPRP